MIKKTIIIAEAVVNHNGKIDLAKKLIEKAKSAGADYIKFQLYNADELVTESARKAKYQMNSLKKNETQKKMLKQYQLNELQIIKLFKYAKKNKIKFMLSVFDQESLNILKNIKLDFIKMPSGEINNFQLLKKVSKLNRNIIFSTGMSTLSEIKKTYGFFKKNKKIKKIFVLHCNSSYPTPDGDVNIEVLSQFKKIFNSNIGYSDHSIGNEAAIVAVALGAKIIEKHLTLNKKMSGPDHSSSSNPIEFKNLVNSIRKTEKFYNSKKKIVTKSEKENLPLVRKSIVAKKKILKGETFSEENLTIKRPGMGISPNFWNKIINKKSKYDFFKDDLIKV